MFNNLKVDEIFRKNISEAISAGTLSHAVILEGSDSETRLLAAKEIACAIVCSSDSKPCLLCSNCKKALTNSHPDIHILEKEEKASNIKVDEIRKLKHTAQLLPNDALKAVFIISEAQFMGPPSQNALLKIFEEPSEYVSFILTCDSKTALLETILSRGTAYQLAPPVRSENVLSSEASALAAELIDTLCSTDEYRFLCKSAVFQKNKELFSETLFAIRIILRDALMLSYKRDFLMSDSEDTAKKLAASFSPGKIIRLIEAVEPLLAALKGNANFNLVSTRFCSLFYQIKLSNI